MVDRINPSTPRPAATGTASARRPMRMSSVRLSTSVAPFAGLTVFQVADLVLDFLFHRAGAYQLRHAAQIAGRRKLERLDQKQHADCDERREADDPQRLRDDGRRLQRGL